MTHNFPTKGQFVVVWKYNNALWSNTYAYRNGGLYAYSEGIEGDEDNEPREETWFPSQLPQNKGQEIIAIFTDED